MKPIFTQNDMTISWICSALQVVISLSAWEKSRDSTPRIFFLEHKMRPYGVSSVVAWSLAGVSVVLAGAAGMQTL